MNLLLSFCYYYQQILLQIIYDYLWIVVAITQTNKRNAPHEITKNRILAIMTLRWKECKNFLKFNFFVGKVTKPHLKMFFLQCFCLFQRFYRGFHFRFWHSSKIFNSSDYSFLQSHVHMKTEMNFTLTRETWREKEHTNFLLTCSIMEVESFKNIPWTSISDCSIFLNSWNWSCNSLSLFSANSRCSKNLKKQN